MTTSYPTSLDIKGTSLFDMVNLAQDSLASAAGTNDVTIYLNSIAKFTSYGGIAWIEDEMIQYTGTSSGNNSLTGVTRGYSGTTAVSHLAGAVIQNRWSAEHLNNLIDSTIAIETRIGITGSDVWVRRDGTLPLTANWDVGGFAVTNTDPKGAYDVIVYLSGSTAYARRANGTLVSSSNAHDVVIQAAINDLVTGGTVGSGGTVFIKTGLYTLSAGVTTNGRCVNIIGEGRLSTQLKLANTINPTAVITIDATRCSVQDLQIDGNNTNNLVSGHGILVTGCNAVVITRVGVWNCHQNGFDTTSSLDNQFFECEARNNTGVGFQPHSTSFDNDFIRCEAGGNGSDGFLLSGSNHKVTNAQTYSNTGNGINIVATDCQIIGNTVGSANSSSGIRVALGADRTRIIGNMIFDNSAGGAATADGIIVSANDCLVSSNMSRNQSTVNQRYGINVTSSALRTVVICNYVQGATANFNNSGTGTTQYGNDGSLINQSVGSMTLLSATTDTQPYFRVSTSGIDFGAGVTSATDTTLARQGASIWEVTGNLAGSVRYGMIGGGGAPRVELRAASSDTNPALRLSLNSLNFGPGAGSVIDTTFARNGTTDLILTGTNAGDIRIGITGAATPRISLRAATADANPLALYSYNQLAYGPGGATTQDTYLIRQAANVLASSTDGSTIDGTFYSRTFKLKNQGAGTDPTLTSNSATQQISTSGGFVIGGSANFIPSVDSASSSGGASNRWLESHSVTHSVRAASGDTNPTAKLSTAKLSLGLNSADNLSWTLTVAATNVATLGEGNNFAFGTTTGTKLGTTTSQKLGFFNASPVIQQAGTGETVGFVAGAGTNVTDQSTFTGNVGSTAYRLSDLVKALKNLGLIAS